MKQYLDEESKNRHEDYQDVAGTRMYYSSRLRILPELKKVLEEPY
jgi:hypothetical protein